MSITSQNELLRFQWEPQPKAAALVADLVNSLSAKLPFAEQLAQQLLTCTGTRLLDWVDHIAVSDDSQLPAQLAAAGFTPSDSGHSSAGQVWRHPGGIFPAVLTSCEQPGLALRVESVEEFLAVHRQDLLSETSIVGQPDAALRSVAIANANNVHLWVLERHGDTGFDPQEVATPSHALLEQHRQAFAGRRRNFSRDAEGFAHAGELIEAAIADLGQARACDLFFAAERAYWQSRNHAARVQKARQDRLGLGWANHDHHTYRASREHFAALVAVLERLGLECRERFYAGQEAGWGAQVMEQPEVGIVVFADVDLAAEEITGDFAHAPLAPQAQLGTVGLWCKLHGEAFLQAGMHHLECQFDFEAARAGLAAEGIETMAPFTDFPFLKQAFTKGETWSVAPGRLQAALEHGYLSPEKAEQFAANGAIGSHLEILERNDGYKGFNQTGVSQIIRQTDPRRQ